MRTQQEIVSEINKLESEIKKLNEIMFDKRESELMVSAIKRTIAFKHHSIKTLRWVLNIVEHI